MFKKILTTALITGQMAFAGAALAASPAQTPEFTLFRTSIALAGQNLPQQEMQARISSAFATYEKTAQPDGQLDRMEQALVDLNMYSPEDAHQLAIDAENAVAHIASTADSQASATQAASDEMAALASKYPQGAQFGACALGWIIGATGGVAAVTGMVIWIEGDGSNHHVSPGVDAPDPHQEHIGEITLGIGALALADGIIIATLSDGVCVN